MGFNLAHKTLWIVLCLSNFLFSHLLPTIDIPITMIPFAFRLFYHWTPPPGMFFSYPLRHNLNSLHWSFFAHLRPDAFLAPVVQNAHYPHSLGNYQEQYLCLSVCLFSPGPNLKLFVGKGHRSFIFFSLLHGHISVFICQASTQWGAEGTWVNQLRVLTSCNAYLSILLLLFLMWISLFSSYKS